MLSMNRMDVIFFMVIDNIESTTFPSVRKLLLFQKMYIHSISLCINKLIIDVKLILFKSILFHKFIPLNVKTREQKFLPSFIIFVMIDANRNELRMISLKLILYNSFR